MAANLTSGQATTEITNDLAGFATNTYAASQMVGLATPAYVLGQDAAYVALASIGTPNGPIALDVNGKVSPSLIGAPSTQLWPAPLFSPPSYPPTNVPAAPNSTQQVFTMPVNYPGFSYRLLVSGMLEGSTNKDTPQCAPQVTVNLGSPTGPLVAQGAGIGELYQWGIAPLGTVSNVQLGNGSEWAQYYSSTGFGTFCTQVAQVANWNFPSGNGWGFATCRCRCLDPVFARTTGPFQQVSITLGSDGGGQWGATNDIYVRMDDTGTYYVRCAVHDNHADLYYSLGGGTSGEVQIGGDQSGPGYHNATGTTYTLSAGNFGTGQLRQFTLTQTIGGTTTTQATWNDTNNATAVGSSYQGWGFGAGVGEAFSFPTFGEYGPSSTTQVQVFDPANPAQGTSTGQVLLVPQSMNLQSTLTTATTLYITLTCPNFSGDSTVNILPFYPALQAVPIPWS